MVIGTSGKWRRRVAAVAMTIAAAFAAAASSGVTGAAAAEAPRWILQAIPTPTHVSAETPRNQVEKLVVEASAGTFALEAEPVGGEPGKTAAIPYDATASEVKSAIAKISAIGAGGVAVSGGAGEYEIAFTGSQGDVPLPLMRVDRSQLEGGKAAVTMVTKGANPPQLIITATNVGGVATNGGTIDIGDVLPSWLEATYVVGFDAYAAGFSSSEYGGVYGGQMSCAAAPAIDCTYKGKVDTGDQLVVFVTMKAGAAPPGEALDEATVSGGGAAEATISSSLPAYSTPAPRGPVPGGVFAALSTNQAGAHPDIVTSFQLDTEEADVVSGGYAKDVSFDLPPGLVGSTVGMPRCSMTRVIAAGRSGVKVCPADTMVGIAEIMGGPTDGRAESGTFIAPIYNIAPSPGEPAAFAFDVIILPVRLDTTVLSNGDYGVRVSAHDLAQSAQVFASTITIWGIPSQHSGPGANNELYLFPPETFGGEDPGQSAVPLMTNPQQCGEPLAATMSMDTWANPGAMNYEEAPVGTLSGCTEVPFGSTFSFLPDTLEAGAPAGYTFNLDVPQQNTAGTLATSSVRHVSLRLPKGVVVNPSAAWGLKACTSVEFYGPNHPSQEPAQEAKCPREAKIGEVEVETPDLERPLKGDVFLGAPECDPCTPQDAEDGKMVKLYLQLVGEGEAGIIVKLEGRGEINQSTGQITTVFDETPQLPFDHMKFVLEGGPRAVLANPRKCGTVTTNGDLQPWSGLLAEGEADLVTDATPSYEFEINQNCFGPEFHPSFKAGMPNIQAGAFGEFTLAFGRPDSSELLGRLSMHMPEGLMGSLTGVPLCAEAQANAGECGEGSKIGEVQVLTGPGADPYLVEGGKVYLTEGYGGAPYGLSIVVPAVAGPYTLSGTTGKGTVVVRAQISVDPHTAQLTVTSGPLPSMLDGIPLQLKAVNVKVNRPHFMFNPTSCDRMAITGTLDAVEGLIAAVESPFQVANCARLPFEAKLSAVTHAKHTRKHGAYLHVTLESGPGQANIREVHVELPKAMPSVLKTLQQACTEQQFAQNPAGCPEGSVVGHAVATTPLVPVPIEGPAYFVSHGGAKFPELVMVLQGYGITVVLNGETFISKAGITSSTFKTVPDVPVTRFDLVLPTGTHPALTGNGDLCTANLTMPTRLVGQSGKVVEHDTKVTVEGCKAAIKVVKHSAKGAGKATIVVQVPSAGKLIASGGGIARAVKEAGGAKRVPITVQLSERANRLLAKHHDRRLKVEVHLRFKPTHGKALTSHVSVLMR